jgi:GMP synthase (glutamine-hydrolysing)
MVKPLLIIKAGETFAPTRKSLGDFEDWIIEKLGETEVPLSTVAAYRGVPLPPGESVCGAIITGSHRMVSDCEPWSETIAAWLRRQVNRLPLLGICYGHQLLAHACGGRVGYHPLGSEVGTVTVRLNGEGMADPLFQGLREFPAHAAHRQTVLQLPPGAVCLASNSFEPHHAFRIGPQAWGVQFHPEFDERVAREYIIHQKTTLEGEKQDLLRLLASLQPTPEATALLGRFARLAIGAES